MRYTGFIRNGRVECDEPVSLPDGTRVEIARASKNSGRIKATRTAKVVKSKSSKAAKPRKAGKPTLLDRLRPVVGSVKGLPKDFAAQHDHYIHGAPKR